MIARPKKTVAIAFSGGDAPGMNAALRAFVRIGSNRHGWGVLGVRNGYRGLVGLCDRIQAGTVSLEQLRADLHARTGSAGLLARSQDLVWMNHASVSGLVGRGGIVLGSARCERFRDRDIRRRVIDLLDDLPVEALVIVGGEGSLAGAACVAAESNLIVVGIPSSIDNYVNYTETALGFDTAVSNTVRTLERNNDTALSHQWIMVVEAMGRHCGQLAMEAGLAAGVEIVLIPEQGPLTGPKTLGIAWRLEETMVQGQSHAIVLVADGVALSPPMTGRTAQGLASMLAGFFHRANSPFPEVEIRESILGHLQRGGAPTIADRILAAHYAEAAWEAITAKPPRSGVVGWRRGRIAWSEFESSTGADSHDGPRRDYLLQKPVSRW